MDLQKIEINIGLDTLSINKSNNITGEIYFSIGDYDFPEKGWDDFVVVILAWWHKALLNIMSGCNGIVQEFDFMDGPLLVRGTKISEDIVELQFIKEKIDSEHLYLKGHTSIREFKRGLLKSTKQLLKELKKRNWQSDDIEELEKSNSQMVVTGIGIEE